MPRGSSFFLHGNATLHPNGDPKQNTLKQLREDYNNAVNLMDFYGNKAQKLLFEIEILEREIKEATL